MYPKDWYTLYYTDRQFETNLDRYGDPRGGGAFSPTCVENGTSFPLEVYPRKRWIIDVPSWPPHLSRNKKGGLLNESSVENFDLNRLPKLIPPETALGNYTGNPKWWGGRFPFSSLVNGRSGPGNPRTTPDVPK